MSERTVRAVEAPFYFTWSLLERYPELCPDDVWRETSGGWPVWQQLYHAVVAFDFFTARENDVPLPLPFSPEVSRLAEVAGAPGMSKADFREFAGLAKTRVEAYFHGLTDADLAEKHAGLSARMPAETTHAQAIGLLAAHTMYHLGSCDAALRNHGLEGAF